MIEALHHLPGLSAEVVGSGPMRSELEHRAKGLAVSFTGHLSATEVQRALERARCLVVPSKDEPWGLVVQEALQHNVPVVASSDMGCVRDLVVDGKNGIVLTSRDAETIAHGIKRALLLDRSTISSTNSTILAEWNFENHRRAFLQAILGTESGDAGPSASRHNGSDLA